ncbi:MAG: 3-phosphoglycerate dehydrogenase [Phycisphaerae bacterium]|nr:3-phosphoglycerate dehydrogenase [Phycisphaerae bacterium]
MAKPLVIQTEDLDAAPAAWLSERCELVRCGAGEKGFELLLASAEGMVVRTYTKVDGAMLAKAPKLKVVGRAGVGLDNIDLEACRGRGVRVVSTPDANTQAVVEFVWALIFDALRPRLFLSEALEKSHWAEVRRELRAEKQINEMTLGVYGLGRIGKRMATMGAALGMRVIYHDLLDIPAELRHGATPVSRDELLAGADILTIHVDGRPSNRNLVDGAAFSRMKPDVILVNAARGFLMDNRACAAFFGAHPDAMALLDVHEPEPFGSNYPLLGMENVHLSPHLAAATDQAQENMSWVVRDVWRVLNGETPEHEAR